MDKNLVVVSLRIVPELLLVLDHKGSQKVCKETLLLGVPHGMNRIHREGLG